MYPLSLIRFSFRLFLHPKLTASEEKAEGWPVLKGPSSPLPECAYRVVLTFIPIAALSLNHPSLPRHLPRTKGYKFDIRQWVLLTSCNPLVVWGFDESYVRFSSRPFTMDVSMFVCEGSA